jgi:hypothetical protein
MSTYKDNGDSWCGIIQKQVAEERPKSFYKCTPRADIYVDWFDCYEDAEKFIKESALA